MLPQESLPFSLLLDLKHPLHRSPGTASNKNHPMSFSAFLVRPGQSLISSGQLSSVSLALSQQRSFATPFLHSRKHDLTFSLLQHFLLTHALYLLHANSLLSYLNFFNN